MSTDEERQRAARQEQDALAAVRLARMNARLPGEMRLVPVILSTKADVSPRFSMVPAEARGYLIPRNGVILDEPIKHSDRMLGPNQSAKEFPRGFILGTGMFSLRVPEWFLDGGEPS